MKFLSYLTAALLTLFMYSDADARTSREIQKETKKLLKSEDYNAAWESARSTFMYQDVREPKVVKKLVDLFKEDYPDSLSYIYEAETEFISKLDQNYTFRSYAKELRNIASLGFFTGEQVASLINQANTLAAEKNKTGEIDFLVTDDLHNLASLYEAENYIIIFQRSVDSLVANPRCCELVEKVFKVAEVKGANSHEYSYLKANLEKLELPISVLKSQVAAVFPDYANDLIKEREIVMALVNDSSDKLIAFELEERLRSQPIFTIIDKPHPKSLVLTIKDFDFAERHMPERSQTIRYNRWEVNIVSGAFFMPDGATYDFDLISGGYEIRYLGAFIISEDDQILETKRVSGVMESTYSFCQDPRIVNVFGGVTRADFIPNADYQSRCSKNSTKVDTDIVFSNAIDAIVQEVMKLMPRESKMKASAIH